MKKDLKKIISNDSELKTGIYHDLEDKDYFSWNAVNNSQLSLLNKSPLHLIRNVLNPPPVKEVMEIGTALHTKTTHPKKFDEQIWVADHCEQVLNPGKKNERFCSLTAKIIYNGRGYCSKHAKDPETGLVVPSQKIVLSPDSARQVSGMHKAILNNKEALTLLEACPDSQRELGVVWTHPGLALKTGQPLKCKAKLDGVGSLNNHPFIVDFKTTNEGGASLEKFRNSLINFGYIRQAAFYRQGLFECFKDNMDFDEDYLKVSGMMPRFFFVVVERVEPFAIQVFECNEEDMALAWMEVETLLEKYRDCLDSNNWSEGYSKKITQIRLPGWAFKKQREKRYGKN